MDRLSGYVSGCECLSVRGSLPWVCRSDETEGKQNRTLGVLTRRQMPNNLLLHDHIVPGPPFILYDPVAL
jgi:hypothetical protein